jgi:hypothetical protein
MRVAMGFKSRKQENTWVPAFAGMSG